MTQPFTITFADEDEKYHPRLHVDEDDRTTFVPVVPGGVYDVRRATDGLWLLVPRPPAPYPHRVVDRYQRGWWLVGDGTWETYPRLGTLSGYPQLAGQRGPLRPVLPMKRADGETLHRVLAHAGTKAAATVLAALHKVDQQCYDRDGHDARLVAGRPGSWESALLPRLAHEVGAGIKAGRVDPEALAVVIDTLRGWIFTDDRFTEVAENLAHVFGRVIDGRGGWNQVADQWLRTGIYDEEVRRLLASTSAWYQPHS